MEQNVGAKSGLRLSNSYKLVVLVLSASNLFWQLYELFVMGHGSWVSLDLFVYLGAASLLLILNVIAFLLPGRKLLPAISFSFIAFGVAVFLSFPHHIVMF